MDRKRLEKTFCWKISSELKLFKLDMLQKEKEDIYMRAYQIDSIIRIYEILVEFSRKMKGKQLQNCLQIPNLLAFLYGEWLKLPDTQNEEMEHSLWSLVDKCACNHEEKGGGREHEETCIDLKFG